MGLKCIVHYDNQNCTYSTIKPLSEENKERIIAAKVKRESLGGDNHHADQCSMIPKEFNDNQHGIHSIPCYKKFTLILSKKYDQNPSNCVETTDEEKRDARKRTFAKNNNTDFFPTECFICGKSRKQKGKKDEHPKIVTTTIAAETIKAIAKEKMKEFYYKAKDIDLIAKELRYHQSCYRDFTRNFNQQHIQVPVLYQHEDTELNPSETQGMGNYIAVQEYIEKHIFQEKQAVSISILQSIYGLKQDSRYRSKLKKRILKDYPDQLEILSVGRNCPEMLIDKSIPVTEMAFKDKDGCIIKCAEYLRKDITKYSSSLCETKWPPSIEELSHSSRNPPESLILFLKNLLQSNSAHVSEFTERIVNSYAADMIASVTRGKTIVGKQFLLALGLHNITGQRKVVDILNRLGHCISYNLTCEIETALAEKAQKLSLTGTSLPLRASDSNSFVLTVFWVDNFDVKVERQTGSTSLNTTHLVAFQEKNQFAVECDSSISFSRTRKRKISTTTHNTTQCSVNQKVIAPTFIQGNSDIASKAEEAFQAALVKYFLWLWIRKQNSFDQIHSSFSGWQVKHRKFENLSKTILTYLPPIKAKVNEFQTIYIYLEYLQMLALQANMRYVNVTLDVGAAINAFKTTWQYKDKFSNVIIHLGDFHFMKENFQVIGDIVRGSGWEDVVFQAGLSNTGSIKAILQATHYNRAFFHHTIVAEALERLLIERFIYDKKQEFPSDMYDFACDIDGDLKESIIESTNAVSSSYESYRHAVRNGFLGKTAQFWIGYLDDMRMQHLMHTAVQENDFNLRYHAWKYFLPRYFALNKTNYARYGSFYVETLRTLDIKYPGLREMLQNVGLSVQAQERYPLRISIDQRGEQTINRDAKTAGGVKSFSTKEESVLKWCLNRSEQAKNTQSLREMCGLTNEPGIYKPARPSQISKSEQLVQNVIRVLKEEYVNPFGVDTEKEQLVNLSSGLSLNDSSTNFLLSMNKIGEEKYLSFVKSRLQSQEISLHEAIKREKVLNFNTNIKKTVTKNDTSIEVNRDILGKLLAVSLKEGRAIDFEKALQFPLSEVPLSLCDASGTMRKTNKSKLQHQILSRISLPQNETVNKSKTAYIVDLMALIRTVKNIPETFYDLAWQILSIIPKDYDRVDLVADCYFAVSIKEGEREKRGSSQKVIIKSAQSKIPGEFVKFLMSGENKTRLIQVLFDVYRANVTKVIQLLKCNLLILSRESECISINESSSNSFDELLSVQEEADTKVIAHSLNYLKLNNENNVLIRSPSGDTDIVVLCVSVLREFASRIKLDNGSGKARKLISLDNIELSESRCASLVGLHAFTGNDYVSSFFRKGKDACWKLLEKHNKFESCFTNLGSELPLSDEILDLLQEYVCLLYGINTTTKVNEARLQLFEKKYQRENKIVDLALLPPCKAVLHLHAKRANAVAYLWRRAANPYVAFPSLEANGWFPDGNVQWIENAFPDDVEEILSEVIDYDFGSDAESDDDET